LVVGVNSDRQLGGRGVVIVTVVVGTDAYDGSARGGSE
jgi:hypothetical protein